MDDVSCLAKGKRPALEVTEGRDGRPSGRQLEVCTALKPQGLPMRSGQGRGYPAQITPPQSLLRSGRRGAARRSLLASLRIQDCLPANGRSLQAVGFDGCRRAALASPCLSAWPRARSPLLLGSRRSLASLRLWRDLEVHQLAQASHPGNEAETGRASVQRHCIAPWHR